MSLRHSYTLFAPLYNGLVNAPTRGMRRVSLNLLGDVSGEDILLCGIGTGLDLPLLPPAARYTGIDLTPAMLKRAREQRREVQLVQGDVMALPYAAECFDAVVMHLILAVVPQPQQALDEAARVLKPGGKLLILDKFLRPGQSAPLRRLLSPLLGRLATRTDVVFEELETLGMRLRHDEAAVVSGWFRHLLLTKET